MALYQSVPPCWVSRYADLWRQPSAKATVDPFEDHED
jgi:hypothetical protein